MPPALALNESSGFMDSPNSLSTFDTPKKIKFLELASKYRSETGKWPEIGSLCDAVGVSIRSFYRHVERDPQFKSEWDEVLLRGEAKLTSKLADMSNPIGPLSVLRRYFPDRWNPDKKLTVDVNVTSVASAVSKSEVYEAELVAPPTKILPVPSKKPLP